MTKLAMVSVLSFLAMFVLAAPASASTEKSTGYTCSYRDVGVTITISGRDNNPYFCQIFNNEFKGQRVYYTSGPVFGVWLMVHTNVRVTVRSANSLRGKVFVTSFARSLRSSPDWVRVV